MYAGVGSDTSGLGYQLFPLVPQFWSAYLPCDTQNKDAVKRILEQMDVIHRMCQLYPETFLCVTRSSGSVPPRP